jgi:hypothetical protein
MQELYGEDGELYEVPEEDCEYEEGGFYLLAAEDEEFEDFYEFEPEE